MIIGIDASRANKTQKTGTEWYAFHLIRWFARIDKDNEYILYTNKPLTDGLYDLASSIDDPVKNSVRYDAQGFQKLKSPHGNFKGRVLEWPFEYFWTQGRVTIEMIFRKPDILFVPSHTLPLIHPNKSAVTIHDVGFARNLKLYDEDIIGPEKGLLRTMTNLAVKIFTLGKYSASNMDYLTWSTIFALKHSKKIITVSNFSKDEMIDIYGADIRKIKVIYNGYKTKRYVKINDKAEIERKLRTYEIEQPYILYVGRLERKKNTPYLIEAFSIFKNKPGNEKFKLVLIGNASYGYDEVNYAIREFGLDTDVIMPGWVKEEDMPFFYNGSSAFIFPSKYEGFGIPLLQAMGCGVPVAASWASSIPEVVGNAAHLFNPNDVYEIAKAIDEVVNNEELRNELVSKGFERTKLFSWEKCARETLKEILSL